MSRVMGIILLAFLLGCASEEPEATRILKQMESSNAITQKVLVGWNEPIDSKKFGLAPNPNIDGKTLAEVVTSQKAGRDDGALCSACHNQDDAQGGYAVPSPKNGASPSLKPTEMVYNRQWVGPDGWALRFIQNRTKPANLKAVMQAWVDNNYK